MVLAACTADAFSSYARTAPSRSAISSTGSIVGIGHVAFGVGVGIARLVALDGRLLDRPSPDRRAPRGAALGGAAGQHQRETAACGCD